LKEPALDYIIKDPYTNTCFYKHKKTKALIHNYQEEYRRRLLTVKLKNAIMVYWLEVKNSRAKPSFEEIIKTLTAKRRAEASNP